MERQKEANNLAQRLAIAKVRKTMFESPGFKYTTGGDLARTRLIGVMTVITGLPKGDEGAKQAEEIRTEINKLLNTVKGIDGNTPLGQILMTRKDARWGDEDEWRWKMEGVHTKEPLRNMTSIMQSQFTVVCKKTGAGLSRSWLNEEGKIGFKVVIKGVPSKLGEGAELLAKVENENPGILTTPR